MHAQTLPANCDRTYTVVAGDTCNSISAKENVSTCVREGCSRLTPTLTTMRSFQLASVNANLINAACTNLFVGEVRGRWHPSSFSDGGAECPGSQELCLGIAGQDCGITHVVVSGDTCLSIAAAAGTTVDTILANNPNVNSACTNLVPGEVGLAHSPPR